MEGDVQRRMGGWRECQPHLDRRGLTLGLAAAASLSPLGPVHGRAAERPRLVLHLVVDQLRGDMLVRYRDRFGPHGFSRLMRQGLYFADAQYGTANTFTASGHAVLATGADTADHGMVANEWFDRAMRRVVYATGDPSAAIVGDPPKPGAGQSPRNLTASTVGDELVAATAGRSRVFAVAGKDRSAVILGGRLGRAYWVSEAHGGFATSRYYTSTLPEWVVAWNARDEARRWGGESWTPLRDAASYRFSANAANVDARPGKLPGRRFPHVLPAASAPDYLPALRVSPFLDALTAKFARELVRREGLGRRAATDYLAISFSGNDYVGHAFGPNSVEAEDHLLRLDRVIAELLTDVEAQVGAGRVLVVLCSDHGVDDIPEALTRHGFDAGRHRPDLLLRRANDSLKARFRTRSDLVQAFVPPGFYLDSVALAEAGLHPRAAEAALAEALRITPGVAYALCRSDLLDGRGGGTLLLERVRRGFHPQRSGDVVIVQRPFWYLYPDAEAFAAMHGSPYAYDTHVPLTFMGAGVRAGVVRRSVDMASLAPTLAAILGIKRPSGTTAQVLPEVLGADAG